MRRSPVSARCRSLSSSFRLSLAVRQAAGVEVRVVVIGGVKKEATRRKVKREGK